MCVCVCVCVFYCVLLFNNNSSSYVNKTKISLLSCENLHIFLYFCTSLFWISTFHFPSAYSVFTTTFNDSISSLVDFFPLNYAYIVNATYFSTHTHKYEYICMWLQITAVNILELPLTQSQIYVCTLCKIVARRHHLFSCKYKNDLSRTMIFLKQCIFLDIK